MVNCRRFLDDYSSFRDGDLPPSERASFHAHLVGCASCSRYHHVLERGTELLQGLPRLEVSDDFGARLQHRIWHEEMDRRRPSGSTRRSGAVALTAAAAGLALGLVLQRDAGTLAEDPPGTLDVPGIGGYFIDAHHPEAGRVTSELVRLGVRVHELPYHDLVYRRDATLVSALAQHAEFGEILTH